MLNKNPDLKRERGYTDPKSYVRNDGSEVLHGKDWAWRKSELWERGTGKCEFHLMGIIKSSGVVCNNRMDDPHHVKPRSRGRDDRLSNLVGLCRKHHAMLDNRKTRFGEAA